MDVLSDILQSVRLKGTVYFQRDFAAPWGMEMPRSPFAQFHAVTRGHCRLQMPGLAEPLSVSAGDMLLFPAGEPHWLADHPDSERVSGMDVLEAHRADCPLFQGADAGTTLLCGHFEFEREGVHPFLQRLPPLIHVRGRAGYQTAWLEAAASLITSEIQSGLPGAGGAVDRLAEVLFIHLLRAHIMDERTDKGFAAALKDEHVAYALELMHADPGRDWSLERIARAAGISRTALAVRFRDLVGDTPMNYLFSRRMEKARKLLLDSSRTIAGIGESVGYNSEAAFNRAFKRRFGRGPGTVRRLDRKSAPELEPNQTAVV